MVRVKYIYDVAVYRLREADYYAQRDAHVEQVLGANRATPEADSAFRAHVEKSYGGPWRFNEIVGYIRLFLLGSQVRGEYFRVDARRIVRTRRKTLWLVAHKLAPEQEIPSGATSAQVLAAIRQYLDMCGKEIPGRHMDLATFDAIAPHVDWRSLLDAA